jgi:hypothetical protein
MAYWFLNVLVSQIPHVSLQFGQWLQGFVNRASHRYRRPEKVTVRQITQRRMGRLRMSLQQPSCVKAQPDTLGGWNFSPFAKRRGGARLQRGCDSIASSAPQRANTGRRVHVSIER